MFDLNGNLLTRRSQAGRSTPRVGCRHRSRRWALRRDLLVGNFGDGKINAFDPKTGNLVGTLNDASGNPLSIPGLWAIIFGNGGRGGDV